MKTQSMPRLRVAAGVAMTIALTFAVVSSAHASMVQKMTVPEMARRASSIVVATASGVSAQADGTKVAVSVEKVLKGAGKNIRSLTLPSTLLNGNVIRPDGAPVMQAGEKCLLFLDKNGRILGGWQGKITLDAKGMGGNGLMQAALEREVAVALGQSHAPSISAGGGLQSASRAVIAAKVRKTLETRGAPSSALRPAASRFFSTFEYGMGSWDVYNNPAAAPYSWDTITDVASLWPEYDQSAYNVGSAGLGLVTNYPNNMETYMDSPSFSMVGASAAYLEFDWAMDLEPGQYGDYFGYWITPDGGSHWYQIDGWNGSTLGWQHQHVSLSHIPIGGGSYLDVRGKSHVIISFVMASNGSNDYDYQGVVLDNVAISDRAVTLSSLNPPSQPAGIDAPIDLYGSNFGTARTGFVRYLFQYWHLSSTVRLLQPIFDLTPTLWTNTHVTSPVPIGDPYVYGYPASAGSGPVCVGNADTGMMSASKNLVVPFGYDGTHWGSRGSSVTVDYYVNPRGVPSRVTQIAAGADTWSNESENFKFNYAGASTLVHDDASDMVANGQNDLIWSDGLPDGVIAWSWPVSDSPKEQDIEFNNELTDMYGDPVYWGDATSNSSLMDIQSIITHELGHWLALRDLYGESTDYTKMMFGYGDAGAVKRNLDGGDIDGLRWIYDAATPHSRAAERVSGADRYAVAVSVARKAYPGWTGVTDVIVASGEDRAMADALAAAGLAGAYDAPILTTHAGSLPGGTKTAIQQMAPVRIHVVGGAGSVSNTVYGQLRSIKGSSGTIDRIQGADRYACAAAVAAKIKQVAGTPSKVFVVNGNNPTYFTDALAVSPVAFQTKFPVVLADSSKSRLPGSSLNALASLGAADVVVVGNGAAVPTSVQNDLAARYPGHVSRIGSGSSRYLRAAQIADWAIGDGLVNQDNTLVGVANKLPDALTGGAAVGHKAGVLMYCLSTADNSCYQWMRNNAERIDGCWTFGGTASVPESVRAKVEVQIQ